jgi:hypothetical protein
MSFEYVCWIDVMGGGGGVRLLHLVVLLNSSFRMFFLPFLTSFRLGWEIRQSQLRVEGRLVKFSLVANQYCKNFFVPTNQISAVSSLDSFHSGHLRSSKDAERLATLMSRLWATRLEMVRNDDSRQPTAPCYVVLFWLVPTPSITRKETG